ncbi:MAG: hypothetical protein V4617_21320 [Gemmatimonadota bacterium]
MAARARIAGLVDEVVTEVVFVVEVVERETAAQALALAIATPHANANLSADTAAGERVPSLMAEILRRAHHHFSTHLTPEHS